MDGKYRFTWRNAISLIIFIIGVVALLLLLRVASSDTEGYDQPSTKAKTEKMTPDLQLGTADTPQEEEEQTSNREQNKRQSYEQMRQVISSPIIE